MDFGKKVVQFYTQLVPPTNLPRGVSVMNPYLTPSARGYLESFSDKFYLGSNKRVLVLGINPGRFGAGITGVTFTDPVALKQFCDVQNDLPQVRELSCVFVYDFIKVWGGPRRFYSDFFLTAVSPLGYVKAGKNYNYYDDSALLAATTPFVVDSIKRMIALGCRTDVAILLGQGKNHKVVSDLNKKHRFFKSIYALEHPRFIMQYRRKYIPQYLDKYHQVFTQALTATQSA